jgi:23S rRNA (pseudouridine1915-N3)-methyltransferase
LSRISIVAVSGKLPRWAIEACDEYLRRLPRGWSAELVEVRAEPRSGGRTVAALRAREAERICERLPAGARMVALDEHGRDLTTAQFAAHIASWRADGAPLAFIIGGADGLQAELMSRCAFGLRVSSFTLPHALARVVLAEQLYRAASLATGHPYHRE